MKKCLSLLLWISIFVSVSWGQTAPFELSLQPIQIGGLPGLQSYAYGQANGKWLLVGGRLDGLHRRQPFASFDVQGNNQTILVVDPVSRQQWSRSLDGLPVAIQEQLSSTNMEFHQEGDFLYLIGGYGYHNASASRKTFANLTALQLPGLVDAIISGAEIGGYFRQISDEQFAVTGGHLKKINQTWCLVGGNRFDGNYNPNGNPTYTQVYTNAVRKFRLVDDGTNIQITHLPGLTDPNLLHRRDYNAVPQILPDGREGITAFSGVFQPTVNLPFLNSVTIDSTGHQENPGFQQFYNHYHCAVLPVYSGQNKEMHTLFFGGIAQFYDSAGVLVQDNNVPFVRTIARITRDSLGVMTEYKLPQEMPGFLGAGSEFIRIPNLPTYANGVIKLDELSADTQLVGYIFGGIRSSAPNIFFSNTGTQSDANNQLFAVRLIRNQVTSAHTLNSQSKSSLKLRVSPNPNQGIFRVSYHLDKASSVRLLVLDSQGREILNQHYAKVKPGNHEIEYDAIPSNGGKFLYLKLETQDETASRKIILRR
jgi:hypothetical protein